MPIGNEDAQYYNINDLSDGENAELFEEDEDEYGYEEGGDHG